MYDMRTPLSASSYFLLAHPAPTQSRCAEAEATHATYRTQRPKHAGLKSEYRKERPLGLPPASATITASSFRRCRRRHGKLLVSYERLHRARAGHLRRHAREALEFVTEINSFCATPDRNSCVAPCLCQCGNGVAIGRAAAGGGTHIICRRNDGVCVDPGANVRAPFERLFYYSTAAWRCMLRNRGARKIF